MYHISRVLAKNIFSWKELDISFDDATAYSFKGSNGSGKSSIFEIITWVLFKKSTKKNVKGDFGKSDGLASITLSDGKGEMVVSRNTDNPTFVTVTHDVADEQISQEQLENLIGASYPIFMSAVMCSQKKVSAFIHEDSDSGKARIFGEMLGCSILDKMRKAAQLKKNTSETEYELIKGKVVVAKEALESAKIEFDEMSPKQFKAHIETLEQRVLDLTAQKKKLNQEFGAAVAVNNEWMKYRHAMSCAKNKRGEAEYRLDQIKALKSKNTVDVAGTREKLKKLESEYSEYFNKSTSQKAVINQLTNSLSQLSARAKLNGDCPTCGSKMTKAHIEHIQKQVVEDNKRIKELITSHNKMYNEEVVKRNNEIIKLTGLLNSVKDYEKIILQHEAGISILNKDAELLEALPKPKKEPTDASELQSKLNKVSADLASVSMDIEHKKRAVESYNSAKERLAEYDEELAKKEKVFFVCKWMFDNLPLMKLHYINNNKVDLEDLINTNLANIDIPFNVKIETEKQLKSTDEYKEAFSFQIFSTIKGSKADKKDLSGGEETCLLLATQFAINDISGINLNIEIYDEVYAELDTRNKETIINMIKDRAKNKQIFTVSHEAEIADSFPNPIHIKKKGGYSVIAK